MLDPFEQRRQQILEALNSQEIDKSRAGGVDARISNLVNGMNKHAHLYTTSSCSGRISVFAEPSAETRAAGKKGGEWVYATHDLADGQEVLMCIQQRMVSGSKLIFRFEPFILAAECRDMATAQQLVGVAREAGFRESGVTATKARTIAGIRCSLRLEVPVADAGHMLVDEAYLQKYLVEFGNEKMEANWARTERLHQLFEQKMLSQKDAVPNGIAQPDAAKRQALPCSNGHSNSPPTAHERHLSPYAVQQLLASGVSPQLLQQIQTAPCKTPQAPCRPANAPLVKPSSKGNSKYSSLAVDSLSVGTPKGSSSPLSSSRAAFRKAAHLLRKRQEDILKRVTCLETGQAQMSYTAPDKAVEAGLKWQTLSPKLQGLSAGALNRWGHSTTLYENKLVVFGGYGGSGAHSRTADLLFYDCTAGVLTQAAAKGVTPPARMGHTAVLFGTTLVIFGGRISPAQPLNDVWALHLPTCTWRCIQCKGPAPSARFRHTAVASGSSLQDGIMVVYGGYDGKETFGDVWKLQTCDWTWQQMATSGEAPQPCHSHAVAVIQQRMFIMGGTQAYQHTFSGLHALDLVTGAWERVQPQPGAPPPSCFSHSMTAVGGLLVVAGGCHTLGAGHIHVFDTTTGSWAQHTVLDGSNLVLCRHTAAAAPDHRSLIILGGGMNCFGFGTTFSTPVQLDLTSLCHTAARSQGAAKTATIGAVARGLTGQGKLNSTVQQTLPGGVSCNGPARHVRQKAATSPVCSGSSSAAIANGDAIHVNHMQPPIAEPSAGQTVHSSAPATLSATLSAAYGNQPGEKVGLAVARLQAKVAKDALKALGWLDQSSKAHTDPTTGYICLPITDEANTALSALCPSKNGLETRHEPAAAELAADPACDEKRTKVAEAEDARGLPASTQARSQSSSQSAQGELASGSGPEVLMEKLVALMQCGLAVVQPMQLQALSRHAGGPGVRLKRNVTELLQQQDFTDEHTAQMLSELPTRWEKLGDLALLPRTCLASPDWAHLGQPLWRAIADALGVARLAMQAPVANTGTRDSQAQLLLGGSGWVQHKEGGVLYSLDVTKCMFSSGNTTERQRMGKLQCSGETVLDLYAGIGYYTLPFLCKAGAARVIACEWNPNAVEALQRNLDLNGVADRCQVLEGDCTLTAPKEVADRVSLGLLPSSQGGWATALAALKADTGGWLHLHHNVTDTEEAAWCEETLATLQQLAHQLGSSWHLRY